MTANDRKLVLSVTLSDCDVQTFRSGGPGGQNQNKRDTGVRVIHRDSGARGESRDERSQLQNKKLAFGRMVETAKFKTWLKVQLGGMDAQRAELERRVSNQVERDLKSVLVEVGDGETWRAVE